jgi:hypothetical protein
MHMSDKDSVISSDEIAIFQVYAGLINSERETLWARHNALLLANSLIIGALAISPAALWQSRWGAIAMLTAGVVISGAWVRIAIEGWRILRRHVDLASTFASDCFKHLPNPFGQSIRAETSLHHMVLLVIAVFVFMYIGLGIMRFSLA